jgi:hypothetical protein
VSEFGFLSEAAAKMRAHRDLFDCREAGDKGISVRDVQKQLKDIWRLGVTLTGGEGIAVAGNPEKDVVAAIEKLEKLPEDQFKQVAKETPAKFAEVMTALRKVFVNVQRK